MVQRAVSIHLHKQAEQEKSTLYNFYGKNLPKRLKLAVSDAAQFTGLSFFTDSQTWEKWKKRINAPYISPDPNIVTGQNTAVDPNSIVDPNSPWDPNLLVDPNRP